MAGVLITGTDTGIGKTLISCALARCFRDRGIDVGVMKPVSSLVIAVETYATPARNSKRWMIAPTSATAETASATRMSSRVVQIALQTVAATAERNASRESAYFWHATKVNVAAMAAGAHAGPAEVGIRAWAGRVHPTSPTYVISRT